MWDLDVNFLILRNNELWSYLFDYLEFLSRFSEHSHLTSQLTQLYAVGFDFFLIENYILSNCLFLLLGFLYIQCLLMLHLILWWPEVVHLFMCIKWLKYFIGDWYIKTTFFLLQLMWEFKHVVITCACLFFLRKPHQEPSLSAYIFNPAIRSSSPLVKNIWEKKRCQ